MKPTHIMDDPIFLRERIEKHLSRIKQLEEALRFCSGSADFGLGGQAEEGWNRLCEPLLKGKK